MIRPDNNTYNLNHPKPRYIDNSIKTQQPGQYVSIRVQQLIMVGTEKCHVGEAQVKNYKIAIMNTIKD